MAAGKTVNFNLTKDRFTSAAAKAVGESFHYRPPSSHTRWDLIALSRGPDGAALMARSKPRAMLGIVARKLTKKNVFEYLSNFRVLIASLDYFLVDFRSLASTFASLASTFASLAYLLKGA